LCGGGIALVVLLDELELLAGGLVARLLEGHLDALGHVLAGRREDAGERPHEADLHRLGGARRPGRADEEQQDQPAHTQ
jgi:hypothetical protein